MTDKSLFLSFNEFITIDLKNAMRILTTALTLLIGQLLIAQPAIQYVLDFDQIQHHELQIHVLFDQIEGDSLTVTMPNFSPGRYAAHNFAKNVYQVTAQTESGEKITIRRQSPYTWRVPVVNGQVSFSYTLFGNRADGTYTGIDASKVHMNMPATFVYAEELWDHPVELIIPMDGHPEWSVATQLNAVNDTSFSAPNYAYFYDSPTMVGAIDWRLFEVDGQTIEIAMIHDGTDIELDAYTEWIKSIVLAEKAVFGSLPSFDFGRYTFIIGYNPYFRGDGMEHRNSTICTSTGSLQANSIQLAGTIAHEFFHSWNIERIRPQSLEPFQFNQPNMSAELWFGEGFTNYYGQLMLCRTGIITPQVFLNNQVNTLNNVLHNPGRNFRGPTEMSQMALFVDAGTANDPTNYGNTFISYYSYGQVLAMGLDLMLRTEKKKMNLDGFMQTIWEKYGQTEIPYTNTMLQASLAQYTGDETFARTFFDSYVFRNGLPDFKTLFAATGIDLIPANPNHGYFGRVKINKQGYITSILRKGTALYEAGMNEGDRLIAINQITMNDPTILKQVTDTVRANQRLRIQFEQIGQIQETEITTQIDPELTFEMIIDKNRKKKSQSIFSSWLDQ